MNAAFNHQIVAAARLRIFAVILAVLVGLAGLSGTWVARELVDVGPQPIAASCQGAGTGC